MKQRTIIVLLATAVFIAAGLSVPAPGSAEVNVSVGIGLPGLVISAPPFMAVIPGTYVYYPPEVSADIFFYHGYWYRPHRGGWYIANGYNGPWRGVARERVPRALVSVPPKFRESRPHHDRIGHDDLRKNWRGWERDRHWDRGDHRGRDRDRVSRDDHRRSDHQDRDHDRVTRDDHGKRNQRGNDRDRGDHDDRGDNGHGRR